VHGSFGMTPSRVVPLKESWKINRVSGLGGFLCSTVHPEAVPCPNEMGKAPRLAWPCPPGKEGPLVELEPCSFLERKETGRRMSGSG
jgi:hypothetical protein